MKTFRLPTLTRGKKIVRNLLAAVLLVVFAWGCMDFPISDPHRSFRRAEGEEMVGPSQYQGDFHTTWDGWAVGTYRDQILLHREDFRGFDYWPRNETGPTLLPIPEGRLLDGQAWFVAVDVPEEAASAKLELTISAYYSEKQTGSGASRQICASLDVPGGEWHNGEPRLWEQTYTVEGVLLEEGGVLFHVSPHSEDERDIEYTLLSYAYEWDIYKREDPAYRAINARGEAVFFDPSGQELGRAVLHTLN